MAKRITGEQIIEPGFLDRAEKELKSFLTLLGKVEQGLKDNIEAANKLGKAATFKNVDEIQKTEKAIDEVKQSHEELKKIEELRVKTQKQLNEVALDQVKNQFALKEALREEAKQARAAAKERKNLENAYNRESKLLNDLRKEYKNLASEEKETTKEGKALLKEITRLDKKLKDIDETVGQNQRSVGNYEKATKKLNSTLKKTGIAAAALFVFAKTKEIFEQNSDVAANFDKILGRVTVTLTVLISRFIKGLPILKDIFIDSFKDMGDSVSDFVTETQISILELVPSLFRANDKIKELKDSLKESEDQSGKTGKSFEDLEKIFEGTGEEIARLIKLNDQFIDQTRIFARDINKLNIELATLRGQQELLQTQSDDTNTSLREQAASLELLLAKSEDIINKEVEIARKREKLAALQAKVLINNRQANEELANATAERIEKEGELLSVEAENISLIGDIRRDIFEQELDFLFDVSDRRKTINENIAADESKSFETRKAALQESVKDIALITEEIANKFAPEFEQAFDIDELLSLEDTRELTRRVQELGGGEIQTQRFLEFINETRQARRDLEEATRDLNKAESESSDIRTDTIAQEKTILALQQDGVDVVKVLDALGTKRLENEIASLQIRKALAEQGSAERLTIEQELNEKLLEQSQKRIDIEKRELEQRRELQEAALGVTAKILERRNQEQISQLDELIDKEKERANELRALAAKGIADAENNLAVQQKRQAQLEKEREQAIQRQKIVQAGLAALEVFQSFIAGGDTVQEALIKTPTSLVALSAIVDAIPGFKDGKEYVGEGMTKISHTGTDDYLARLHEGERVVTAEANALIPRGMKDYELAMAARLAYQNKDGKTSFDDHGLREEMRQVKHAIENKPTLTGIDFNSMAKYIIETVERKGRTERNHFKKSGVFGS